jgi:hypothetical protein
VTCGTGEPRVREWETRATTQLLLRDRREMERLARAEAERLVREHRRKA